MGPNWIPDLRFLIAPVKRPVNPLKVMKLNRRETLAFTTAFLGWALDATDYFSTVYAVPLIAKEFNVQPSTVTASITLTLLFRPLGALIFGLLADRFGRKTPLMIDVFLFAAFELASGFAPDLNSFFILRCFFGIAMGGEWGLGGSLAMEALPAESRGVFSGLLQQGYATGNLFAAALFYAITPTLGWRALFWISAFPAVLIFFIRFFVDESDAWKRVNERRSKDKNGVWKAMGSELAKIFRSYWILAIYSVLLMTCFNFFSHGSQDLFPTYLQKQLGYSAAQTTTVSVVQATGAIVGGTILGYMSDYIGRRRTIAICAICAGAVIPLWIGGQSVGASAGGAWLMQFFVQGAWGVVPAHLNELSPIELRGTFPSLCYQLGNMISSSSAQIEAVLGEKFPLPSGLANYGLTQGIFMGITCGLLLIFALLGPENLGKDMNAFDDEVRIEDDNIVVEDEATDVPKDKLDAVVTIVDLESGTATTSLLKAAKGEAAPAADKDEPATVTVQVDGTNQK